MTKKKKDNDIVVSFVGGSRDDVTGSCVLVAYPKHNGEHGLIAIEMGLIQGEPTIDKDYIVNKKMLENIYPQHIEAVFLGHCHIDHIGNLPICNDDNGFKGVIIGSEPTIELGKKLLIDSAYIHNRNIEVMKSNGRRVKPLYTEPQAHQAMDHMMAVEVGVKHKLNEYIEYRLLNNSHVLGSCMIQLWIRKPNNQVKSIIYSSDLGSSYNLKLQPFIKETEVVTKGNIFICEATYGSSNRGFTYKEALAEREDMKKTIENYLKNGNRVFIPSFSFSRTQLLMTMLKEWFDEEEWFRDIPVVLDGKLMHDINSTYLRVLDPEDREYFRDVMNWKNFKYNKDYKATLSTLSQRTCGIYIASSGFLTAGRSVEYIKNFLSSSKDCVVFVGYAGGVGSLGYKILNDEQKTVSIEKTTIIKRCNIKQYKTFSSHIQQDEIFKLWKQLNVDKIIVHHSSAEAKDEVVKKGKEELMKCGKTTPVVAVNKYTYQFVI